MNFILEEVKKYEGVAVPVKAGFLERSLKKKAKLTELHPNPADEFCMPEIGPNNQIISDYATKMKEARMLMAEPWRDWDGPLIVEKMRPDGYMVIIAGLRPDGPRRKESRSKSSIPPIVRILRPC